MKIENIISLGNLEQALKNKTIRSVSEHQKHREAIKDLTVYEGIVKYGNDGTFLKYIWYVPDEIAFDPKTGKRMKYLGVEVGSYSEQDKEQKEIDERYAEELNKVYNGQLPSWGETLQKVGIWKRGVNY